MGDVYQFMGQAKNKETGGGKEAMGRSPFISLHLVLFLGLLVLLQYRLFIPLFPDALYFIQMSREAGVLAALAVTGMGLY